MRGEYSWREQSTAECRALIGLMIVAVGWIEDRAAKRRPRLWPNGSRKARQTESGSHRR